MGSSELEKSLPGLLTEIINAMNVDNYTRVLSHECFSMILELPQITKS